MTTVVRRNCSCNKMGPFKGSVEDLENAVNDVDFLERCRKAGTYLWFNRLAESSIYR